MIFVDTSAWLAVYNVQDGNHAPAVEHLRELLTGRAGRLVTTDFVLDESLTLIRKRAGSEVVREFTQRLASSRSVQEIGVTPEHYRSALTMFLDQGPSAWSLTDCTSFVVMRELGIAAAFTFDADFRAAGFEVRPRDRRPARKR
ncbi:MAG TPA: PIN domain-containing protein [Thermoplasmata archaeon]|nr:PIN domain-containing protein [Thermoplasmata archaeon]